MLLLALVIASLSFALFSGALRNGFVNYDDDVYVYGNSLVTHGVTWAGVLAAFSQSHARNWHPLTTLSHMIDCQLFGVTPLAPHAINVFLHALAAAGLFIVLFSATRSTWRAALVAIIFAVHPLRVESVAWISERKDVLSASLFVATLGAYLWYVRRAIWSRMFLVALLYAAALMAKPMVVTLPLILLLLDFWPLRRVNGESDLHQGDTVSFRHSILEKWPLFAFALVSCWLTMRAARGQVSVLDPVPLVARAANALLSYNTYILQLFWPAKLAVFYPYQPFSYAMVLGAAFIFLTVTFLSILFRRHAPYFFVGWLWYVVMLVPVIGLVPIGLQAHADRYTYLPEIGLLVALVWGCRQLFRRQRTLRLVVASLLVVLLSAKTWQQVGVWRDSESLWQHTLGVTSLNDVALNNLGAFYESKGEIDRARELYDAALAVLEHRPEHHNDLNRAFVYTNLGNLMAREHNFASAAKAYREALKLCPQLPGTRVNLGDAAAQLGDWRTAAEEFSAACELQPRDADAQYRAGIALIRLGRVGEAIERYGAALSLDPTLSAADVDLGNALLESNRLTEALEHYQRGAKTAPNNVDAHFNLGRVYLLQNRSAEAVREYEQAAGLAPKDAEVQLALGNAAVSAGMEERALTAWEAALALAPDFVSVLNNLAWLKLSAKDSGLHDPARALSLAKEAVQVAREPSAPLYRTLAAAYAATGDIEDARIAAERCRQLARDSGDNALAEAVQQELQGWDKPRPPG